MLCYIHEESLIKVESNFFEMTNPEVGAKIKHILIEISRNEKYEQYLIEVLTNSKFDFEPHWNHRTFPNLYNLQILIAPEVFTKNFQVIANYERIIKTRIIKSSYLEIDTLKILPDYDKLKLVNSQVTPIRTEWDEINLSQEHLIEDLKRSKNSTDYQNIGNTCRILMEKVAKQVFVAETHKPTDPNKLVHSGKFKNQLHSYIDFVLSGEKNKEFRKLANSSIDFVENACDLMSATTHKLNAEKPLAEVCVISSLSAISIINLIRHLE